MGASSYSSSTVQPNFSQTKPISFSNLASAFLPIALSFRQYFMFCRQPVRKLSLASSSMKKSLGNCLSCSYSTTMNSSMRVLWVEKACSEALMVVTSCFHWLQESRHWPIRKEMKLYWSSPSSPNSFLGHSSRSILSRIYVRSMLTRLVCVDWSLSRRGIQEQQMLPPKSVAFLIMLTSFLLYFSSALALPVGSSQFIYTFYSYFSISSIQFLSPYDQESIFAGSCSSWVFFSLLSYSCRQSSIQSMGSSLSSTSLAIYLVLLAQNSMFYCGYGPRQLSKWYFLTPCRQPQAYSPLRLANLSAYRSHLQTRMRCSSPLSLLEGPKKMNFFMGNMQFSVLRAYVMTWVPRGMSLTPLNLLPTFHEILSIPNYSPSGASSSNRTPEWWKRAVIYQGLPWQCIYKRSPNNYTICFLLGTGGYQVFGRGCQFYIDALSQQQEELPAEQQADQALPLPLQGQLHHRLLRRHPPFLQAQPPRRAQRVLALRGAEQKRRHQTQPAKEPHPSSQIAQTAPQNIQNRAHIVASHRPLVLQLRTAQPPPAQLLRGPATGGPGQAQQVHPGQDFPRQTR